MQSGFFTSASFLIIFAVERKPELYAIVIILYTILLVQAFHDGFYDRKPDTTSTVFSGPCLVHFVKFIPQFRNILLRDRCSCVKYSHSDTVILRDHTDLDLLLTVQMIQCVAGIVRHNFLDLELICPDIDRL